MSIKSKALAFAAAATIVAGIGTAGTLSAGAATPSCGSNCVDLFSRDFGTHKTPGFALDVLRQASKVGQPVILFKTSNSDPAEDFSVSFQGLVSDLYTLGFVSPAVVLHYGCGWQITTSTCSSTINPITALRFPDDWAFEVQYTPFGVDSGLCVGVGSIPVAGTRVALEPCGLSSKTFWVVDQADSSRGRLTPVLNEYVPLINASETNISQPLVLTYPKSGYPTDKPRPQLTVQNLTGFTNPSTGDPQGVDSDQLWGADLGTLK
jgi:hypothetical protein